MKKKYPVIKCENIKIIEGARDLEELKKHSLWIMEFEDSLRVVADADFYMQLMDELEKLKKENFELKLEKAILAQFPIDYEDVKAVVLEELKDSQDKNLDKVVEKIKLEHPNLFYNIELDNLL